MKRTKEEVMEVTALFDLFAQEMYFSMNLMIVLGEASVEERQVLRCVFQRAAEAGGRPN